MLKNLLVYAALATLTAQAATLAPVNPSASAKAKAVYTYLQDLKGKGILSGQESMLWDSTTSGNTNYTGASPYSFRDRYVSRQTGGKFPAIYESDFGDISTSALNDRQRVVDIIKARAPKNTIFMLNWHTGTAALPDGDGYNGAKTLTDAGTIIDKMLTPGDAMNTSWLNRLDGIAGYLKQLRDSNIVVMWRPFHENNGNFFWWGQQPRFKELWQQMYDRFTRYHKLDNLLWVYNANHFGTSGTDVNWVRKNYPGDTLVDVMSIDVYAPYFSFQKHMYDTLKAIGGDKPVGISENGLMPEVDKLFSEGQNYVFWVTWWGFETTRTDNLTGNAVSQYPKAYGSSYTITEDEINFNIKSDGKKSLGVTATAGGTVTRSIDGRVDSGTVVTLTATPSVGYDFTGWSGDTTATVTTLKVTVNKDRNLLAVFTPGAGTNLIKGGTFTTAADQSAWVLGNYPTPDNASTVNYANGSAAITVTATDTTDFGVQIRQGGIPLDSNVTYVVTFDAFASVARDITPTLTTGDWMWQSNATVSLTTTKAPYSIELKSNINSADGMIQFCVGKLLTTVTIDNVTMVRKGSASVASRGRKPSVLSVRAVEGGFAWLRGTALTSPATVRVVDVNGSELARTQAAAGATTGILPAAGSGLRFVVLESQDTREVHALPSLR
ncbi:MAG: carbohydrate binding domain-containing protein [Fibrobacteres bacterium]|nr:carbohydrate binding domain-containing protein [Fibrobacterota bacterium]